MAARDSLTSPTQSSGLLPSIPSSCRYIGCRLGSSSMFLPPQISSSCSRLTNGLNIKKTKAHLGQFPHQEKWVWKMGIARLQEVNNPADLVRPTSANNSAKGNSPKGRRKE